MPTKDDQFDTGLRIELKATNLEVSKTTERYLNKKLATLERHLDPEDTSISGQVELECTTRHHRHGLIFRAEMNLSVQGVQYRAESTSEDLHAAIDEMKDAIVRELSARKTKDATLVKKGGQQAKAMLRDAEAD